VIGQIDALSTGDVDLSKKVVIRTDDEIGQLSDKLISWSSASMA